MRWFKSDEGFKKRYFFDTVGVVNKGFVGKVISTLKILRYTIKCRSIFQTYKIDAVFSVGGYSAAPASFAALIFRKPLYIHEQNSVMGKLNSLLSRYAHAIFSSYDKSCVLVDYPVRNIFFQNARVRTKIKTIIFLGGSQGASSINKFAMSVAKILNKRGIKIIHQCGDRDFKNLSKFYKRYSIDVDLFTFEKHLEDKIKIADFAVSRSGASTMWELCASTLPALYIPYPYAAANHQYYNAKFLEESKLAFLCRDVEVSIDIMQMILDSDQISTISLNLQSIIKPDGAKKIVDYLTKIH
jgi:UDP-N-acetylglucosamine--N-acetylmuramyl-(pentapeptide) pyrophosphoryl-undecaprenol N-acetylglucosamine transferase